MREKPISVEGAAGKVLARTLSRSDGKKLLARGHLVTEPDVRVLREHGVEQVWVFEIGEQEIGEDQAALVAAGDLGIGSVEVRPAAGGRANLFATEAACLLVNQDLLKRINLPGGLAVATVRHFSYVAAGQRTASVKTAPFVVSREQLDEFRATLQAKGPVLQARPIRLDSVAVVYCDPASPERARERFEPALTRRLERFGARAVPVLSAIEEEAALATALASALDTNPGGLLIASTTAPAGPSDVVGRAMLRAGCSPERFLAPVEPGHLFLLGYRDAVPVISAPGCFHSAKPNVLDLVLPPILAQYRITAGDIASLGHGGLLD
jgi:molybdenum cofactor cytidylyltransferase